MLKVFAHHFKALTVMEFLADTTLCFLAIVIAGNQLFSSSHALREGLEITAAQITTHAFEFTVVMALMYSCAGVYRRSIIAVSLGGRLGRAFLALFVGALIAFAAMSIHGQGGYALELLGRTVVYVAFGVVLVRGVSFLADRSAVGARRVLIVGTGPEARGVARDLRDRAGSQATVVGYYPAGAPKDDPIADPCLFPRNTTIDQVVRENRVDEIVVAVREQRGGSVPMDQLLACRIQGVRVLDLAGFYEEAHGEVPIDSLKASWLVYGHGFVQGAIRTMMKRMFDIVCASLLLVAASPMMLLAVIAIRFGSKGPILYRQERVGLGGRNFMCIKFRSMRTDAEKDGVAVWAAKNDSRITRVGAFMRKTRVDELPQLFSVLRGEMSLVGPRPERPTFVGNLREQIPFYDIRHSVKPGITGWAQVNYGYGASMEDSRRKHQFDLYYVKNNSLLLDLLVLMQTVSVVVFREGSQ